MTSSSRRSFHESVKLHAKHVGLNGDELVRGVVRFAWKTIVPLTPIDTGRARASYRIGVNKIDRSFDRRPIRGAPDFAAMSVAGNLTQRRHGRSIKKLKAGQVIWLTNNLRYILDLEDGTSPQSQYMLRTTYARTVLAFPVLVREARARGGK